jgi:5-(carboxyamino)imidazole ribonucleotide mutase
MGSTSDWDTMSHAVDILEKFGVAYEKEVVSAHRTPVWMAEFAQGAENRGIQVNSAALQGLDSLLSIVQMPGGIPVGTLAIGKPGAINAGLLAVGILATTRPELRERLRAFRAEQTAKVRQDALP